ncbi:cipC protein [Rickenella mellea]|uniref:CipC protein n=1 Tax=Rickenella mellea TaxID=50990 RepID=A0A4R5XFF2_9AGAM|nr:cipC protein [Rickenella mellea]
MGWFGDNSNEEDQYNQVTKHKAELSHELLGGAAAFEAAKAYEDHCAKNGKPDSHAKAKEFVAGAIGAFLDREIETRGLNEYDKLKDNAAKRAQAQAEEKLANDY